MRPPVGPSAIEVGYKRESSAVIETLPGMVDKRFVRSLEEETSEVSAAFSPDGKTLHLFVHSFCGRIKCR